MNEDKAMKLICEYPVGTLRNAVTVSNVTSVAMALRQMPGVGKPFLIFASLPGKVVAADFDMFQNEEQTGPKWLVSQDVAANVAAINEQLAAPPTDALTFEA
jgi:hypothetical protein